MDGLDFFYYEEQTLQYVISEVNCFMKAKGLF